MTPPLDLEAHIENAIAAFEQERDEKWDDPVEGAKINKLADAIASLLLDSATTLLTEVDQSFIRDAKQAIGDKFDIHDELLEALQLRVAQRFLLDTKAMSERALELLALTLPIWGAHVTSQRRRRISTAP
jgi:hypothetical protein